MREEITYERMYSVYTDAGGWEYFNTPAEAGRRVEEVLVAGLPRYRTVAAGIEDRPKESIESGHKPRLWRRG